MDCYTCWMNAGEHSVATVTADVEDEANGWQTWHYCEECADALGISDGDEISLDDQRAAAAADEADPLAEYVDPLEE